jgi:choline-glycine betaine transporter
MAYYRSQDAASTSLINTPFQNDDGRAQQAIFMTLYHYGLQAWGVYVLVTCLCVWRIRRVYFENWGGPFEISNIWSLEK